MPFLSEFDKNSCSVAWTPSSKIWGLMNLIISDVSRKVEGITGSFFPSTLDLGEPLKNTLKSSMTTCGGRHFRTRLLNNEESGHNRFNFADLTAPNPAFEDVLLTVTFDL